MGHSSTVNRTSGREVATRVADGPAPRLDGRQQVVDVVAERGERRSDRLVGAVLDVLAHRAAVLGQPAIAVEQPTGPQPGLAGVQLLGGPAPSGRVGAWGQAPRTGR